jgi:transposase
MNKTPPSYTEEFKRDAVRLVETSGKSKTQIARDLGISDSALYRWLKEYRQGQGPSASASGQGGPSLRGHLSSDISPHP